LDSQGPTAQQRNNTGAPPPATDQGDWGQALQSLLGGDVGGAWGHTPEWGKWGIGAGGGLLLLMLLSRMFGKQASYTPEQHQAALATLEKHGVALAPRYSRLGKNNNPAGKFPPGHAFQGSRRTSPRVRQTGADAKINDMLGE
jgi:hypothetical protein